MEGSGWLWIALSVWAAFAQTLRNTAQRSLTASLGTLGATLVRFLYGLRTVLPFTIGMSTVPTLRFQLLNFAGAVLWASSGAVAGYLFGNAIEAILGDIQRYEKYVLALLAAAGLAYWWFSRRRKV